MTRMIRAATYLRSSKDKSDVSIDAQRRELRALAEARGYTIVGEFSDVVISANEERPGFQDMLAALKRPDRGWDAILVMDPSRLARGVYFAQVFNHECEKHGVKVAYSKIPELDPMVKIMLLPVLQANDELHSYMSRVKGLAGMRENVLKGYRAGGRAPWGYRLKRNPTGAMRDGSPVTKSTLEPDPAAASVTKAYLEARARGVARSRAAQEAGARMALSSLVGTDWQALTYAGHTAWNVHNAVTPDGYRTGRKRKPRVEWTVQRNTHEPLITDEQAERILHSLETSSMREALSAARGQASRYLLCGLLRTPGGVPWHGCQQRDRAGQPVGYYRSGSRLVSAVPLERAIVARVLSDLRSDHLVEALVRSARKAAPAKHDPAKALRHEQRALARDVDRMLELAGRLADPGPALRRVDALEAQRKALTARIDQADRERAADQALAQVTPATVRELLGGLAAHADRLEGSDLKRLLEVLIERVELAPEGAVARLCYAIEPGLTCGGVAFPRRSAASAGRLRWAVRVQVTRRKVRPAAPQHRIGTIGPKKGGCRHDPEECVLCRCRDPFGDRRAGLPRRRVRSR